MLNVRVWCFCLRISLQDDDEDGVATDDGKVEEFLVKFRNL